MILDVRHGAAAAPRNPVAALRNPVTLACRASRRRRLLRTLFTVSVQTELPVTEPSLAAAPVPLLLGSDLVDLDFEPPLCLELLTPCHLPAGGSHPKPGTSPISDRKCRSGEQF
jgi:hypothetical protein